MITAIKADTISKYKALFDEATDILSGYKRVKTYDTSVNKYYYKNGDATTFAELYLEPTRLNDADEVVPAIYDLASFASTLEKYTILYVKEGEPAEGFEPMLGITTLEEYFSWIKNLGLINKKYTVLPLDEPHFEINANTRAINIPADFKKNGIAVQSDDLAEILYFKVDRYVDYMDLNNCDIFIQWEAPKDANGTVVKAISPEYIRDIESEPGKLIFGWALSDSITKTAGTLKFSVRFFQWADNEKAEAGDERIIAYSFSTLTATCTILPSININPEEIAMEDIEDVTNILLDRLENSVVVGGYAAAVPEFIKDLDVPNADLIYDLDADSGELALLVQAKSSDTGAVTYTWKRQALNEDNTTTDTEIYIYRPEEVENAYVEADKTKMDPGLVYYDIQSWNDDGTPGVIVMITAALTAEQLADENFKVYLKQSKIVADQDGVYWAVAENRITNSSASQTSKKATFPRPEYVRIVKHPVDKGILADGEYTLSVEANNTDGVLSYQWLMDDNYLLNFGDLEPEWTEIEGATEATYVATEQGHYKVEVTNTRNKREISDISEYSRVTNTAATPVFAGYDLNEKEYKVNSLTDENCPVVNLDETVETDGYTVVWYLSWDNDKYAVTDEINLGLEGKVTRFNPKNFENEIDAIKEQIAIHEGKDPAEADSGIDGAYFAIVTNHVNGSAATSEENPDYDDMFKITY